MQKINHIAKNKYKINIFFYFRCLVCYLRLDFESFTLLGPADTVETLGGACSRDTFKVTVSYTRCS